MTPLGRACRVLVRLQPRRLREEFGDDMVALFEEQVRDEGAGRACARALLDAAIAVPTNHLEAHMKRSSAPAVVVLFTVLAVLSVVLGGPAGVLGGAVAGVLAAAAWRRSRPISSGVVWWKPLAGGAALLAGLVAVTTVTGELDNGMWYVAMAVLLTALLLLAAGLVLGVVAVYERARGASA